MIINLKQFIVLLPLLIISLTIIITLLAIIIHRHHFFNFICSILGLNVSLLSLWFVHCYAGTTQEVTSLIHIDNYSMLYDVLVLISSIITCIFSYPWLKKLDDYKEEFYLIILIATFGSIILVNASHLATVFFGIELFSIPLFGLVGYDFYQKYSLEASIKYMILSVVASSFLLFGISILYIHTGKLSFIELAKIFSNDNIVIHKLMLLISLGMMIVGIGFKLSLVPFHLWTPDVYQGSPLSVAYCLSTMGKIAIFSILARVFSQIPINNSEKIHLILNIIASTSIIFGNLMALHQTSIKRLLAYSSISHFGYLIMMLNNAHDILSIESINIYLISYLLNSIGIFGAISIISNLCHHSINSDSLLYYRGLFWRSPTLSLIMTLIILSLAGVPMTLGFISKFYLLLFSVQTLLWWPAVAVIVSSTISIYYYLRIMISLYLTTPNTYKTNNDYMLNHWQYSTDGIILLITALLLLILGIYPQPLITITQYANPILCKSLL